MSTLILIRARGKLSGESGACIAQDCIKFYISYGGRLRLRAYDRQPSFSLAPSYKRLPALPPPTENYPRNLQPLFFPIFCRFFVSPLPTNQRFQQPRAKLENESEIARRATQISRFKLLTYTELLDFVRRTRGWEISGTEILLKDARDR